MKRIPTYMFYKHKYGEELLIDVVSYDKCLVLKSGISVPNSPWLFGDFHVLSHRQGFRLVHFIEFFYSLTNTE